MYDGERRKSMAVEKSAAQLKSENQSLRQEVSKLEDEVNQLNQVVTNINAKMRKADQIIVSLESDNDRLKEDMETVQKRARRYGEQESGNLREQLDDAERELREKEQ